MSLINKARVAHACTITSFGYISNSFITSYTSPIEDDLLLKGVFTVNTYILFGSALNIGGLCGSRDHSRSG